METIAQEAKRLLEPIPEDNWIIGQQSDSEGNCCLLGHLSKVGGFNMGRWVTRGQEFLLSRGLSLSDARTSEVNDGFNPLYQQPTTKQRVMALLDDMIAAGY